jgi:hypothetical protein
MLVMNPGFFVPVCLLAAKVQKNFQKTALMTQISLNRQQKTATTDGL